jgi:mannose-6-phosphate isomerase
LTSGSVRELILDIVVIAHCDRQNREGAVSDAGPVLLGPNQPQRFYRGGPKIAAFRGGLAPAAPAPPGLAPAAPTPGQPAREVSGQPTRDADHRPEDWVGSATTVFGTVGDGLTRLPDGRLLRDAIGDDPAGYLGPRHVQRYGSSPALLVKLLDAGQRLPVHCHPGDAFAQTHLASAFGKTEAWIVVDAPPGSEVFIGFAEAVSAQTLARWVADQAPDTLRALNRVPVRPGDAILIPAGLPHAIGEGVFLVELQEPTDLSVLLEWESFPINGRAEGHLGLGFDLALNCVDRSAWDAPRLGTLCYPPPGHPPGRDGPVASVFPAAADPYFAAQRIRPGEAAVALDPAFAILVVLSGHGLLRTEQGDELGLGRGMTILMPYAAGRSEISGRCELVRCLPPYGSP